MWEYSVDRKAESLAFVPGACIFSSMKLAEYLEDRSSHGFAARAEVDQTTILRLLAGEGCSISSAARIVAATGGLVSFMDLVPSRPTVKERRQTQREAAAK